MYETEAIRLYLYNVMKSFKIVYRVLSQKITLLFILLLLIHDSF